MAADVSTEELWDVLVARVARVIVTTPDRITREARFDEDLRADSLDLVEIIEGVEQDLRARGATISLGDDDLAGFETVGQAADAIGAALAHPE